MTFLGVLFLIGGICLVLFRQTITRKPLWDGASVDQEIPVQLYVNDPSSEQSLMVVGVLLAVLGIGLILMGLNKSAKKPNNSQAPT